MLKYLRKITCLLLALAMVLGIPPIHAAADETEDPTPAAQETTAQTTEETTEETEPAEETEETVPETEEDESWSSQSSSMSAENPDPPPEDEVEFKGFDEIPLYLQTDYRTVRYSKGTLYTSGCTMACVAMVASYLRQEEILPDELAKRFGTYDASNLQRMEAASICLDLEYSFTPYFWEVKEALRAGKPVIALMEASGWFTNTQHTVVLTGITSDGKILVNDPYGPNYEDPYLEDGFEHGFDEDMITDGFGGAWIYEEYEEPNPGPSRYPGIHLTQEDKDLLAKIIWLESRGEEFRGQQAIAEIILNRLASGKFNKTLKGVIMAEGQFSTTKFLDDAEPGELQYKAIEKALSGPNVLPENVYYFGRKVKTKNVWGRIGGHIFCYSD